MIRFDPGLTAGGTWRCQPRGPDLRGLARPDERRLSQETVPPALLRAGGTFFVTLEPKAE